MTNTFNSSTNPHIPQDHAEIGLARNSRAPIPPRQRSIPLFRAPTLTRSTNRAMFDALTVAVHRYNGSDSRGAIFYQNDARLWWLWLARRHPSWLTDEQLALLCRWTMAFRKALVGKYTANCEREGKAREQSDLAYVHTWLLSTRISLYDTVELRTAKTGHHPPTKADQQAWLVAHLPASWAPRTSEKIAPASPCSASRAPKSGENHPGESGGCPRQATGRHHPCPMPSRQ